MAAPQQRRLRWPSLLATMLLALSLVRVAATASPQWLTSWQAAPQLVEVANNPPSPLAGTVVRQFVHASAGGTRLRVLFGNVFGGGPLTILAAHVAASAAGPGALVDSSIDPATDTPLTFSGAPGATVPAGASLWSDEVAFALAPLSNLGITTAFGAASTSVSGHPGSRTTSYQLAGTNVSMPAMPSAAAAAHWYAIQGLDVAVSAPLFAPTSATATAATTAPAPRACVALGDSITDGRGSTTDGNDRWPDVLSARLLASSPGRNVSSLVNAGIGGNAITGGGLGPTALARFARDVLGQSGVASVIVFEGVNDIGGGVPAPAVIAALGMIRRNATAAGLTAIGATITPFFGNGYYSAEHEAARQAVNAFIRGPGGFDAVLDFDTVLSDGGSPPRLRPEFDSGDGLHPNPAGYKALADSVDLDAVFG
jgi:lysophospholipase L1-like esterase